jgi:spore germination protein YaaH
MLTISGQPARITADLDPDVLVAAHAARVHVIAILSSYAGQSWDTDAVEGLIQADATVQDAFGDKLVEVLRNMGASGVMIDWQQIEPTLASKMVDLFRKLRPRLHQDNLELWLSIPVGDDLRAFDLEDLPDVVDHLVGAAA